jgi:hypothetical protein
MLALTLPNKFFDRDAFTTAARASRGLAPDGKWPDRIDRPNRRGEARQAEVHASDSLFTLCSDRAGYEERFRKISDMSGVLTGDHEQA